MDSLHCEAYVECLHLARSYPAAFAEPRLGRVASGVSFFTLSVLMDAGVTAGVESFAFFEGDELTVLMAFIGVRIPVEAGSDIVVPTSDDLYTRRDAKQRQLCRLPNATISPLPINACQSRDDVRLNWRNGNFPPLQDRASCALPRPLQV